MTLEITIAWFHYVAILVMAACLLGEHIVFKPKLEVAQAKTLQTLDMIYGMSAGLVIATGIWRMWLEKGPDYYLHHFAFHILIGLFVVIGLLSVYPTVVFVRWRKATAAGQAPDIAPGQFKAVMMVIRIEMTLLLIAPLFAAWMAHKAF